MSQRIQIYSVWMYVLSLQIGLVAFFIIAKFIPPHWPSWTADVVAKLYSDNQLRILIGMVLSQMALFLSVPFYVAIYLQMKRIEGDRNKGYSVIYLISTIAVNVVNVFMPSMFFITAAYRPGRHPDVTQALNDIGWFYITFPTGGLFFLMLLAMGACFLTDVKPQPLFPRWVGFLNFWMALLTVPAILVPLLYNGPFAWNGILAFWMPIVVFGGWVAVMIVFMLKAIKRDDYLPLNAA